MNLREAGSIEVVTESSNPATTASPRRGRKASSSRTNGDDSAEPRFFLSKAETNDGVPQLGQEFKTEKEAIGASYKTNLGYFVIEARRGIADLSGKHVALIGVPFASPSTDG